MARRPPSKSARPVRQSRSHARTPASQPVSAGTGKELQPAPAILGPSAEAVTFFEQAVDAFHRKQYGLAADRLRVLLDRFPAERALLDRTRTYLQLAERELNRQPVAPRTLEERLTAATAALNNGQDAEAERLARTVLADESRQELALYLMAAIEARRGEKDAALSFLGRAIAVSPEVRAQARHDGDFETLRDLQAFQALVDPPTGSSGFRRIARRPLR